ncbi:CAMK family protein kinase [Histomonas meleagridis]|uniref:CAMK family protein kinase n=1 Tax=Histomonas meleagridis TaxID=135588 RepID=UPI003559FCD7|nr:CAMK family protein kinase [Histomonas meleagridis]KAH0798068.1 CAMK family protein kinase [Histomonas meleagridis]
MLVGKYRMFHIIGAGTFSTVKYGQNILTNEPVAVKIISKSSSYTNYDKLMECLEIMRRLDHPGIVKLIDFLEDESSYFMILEYCGGGELFDFITSRRRVEEPLAKRLFKQIVLTVGYCHSQNVVHRDLKPENLLLTEMNTVKLIDFGLASGHADQPLTDRCGSSCYISPESLTTKPYSGITADIWALGVILYALVDGSLPWNYQDSNIMYQQIINGDFPMPQTISIQCQDLIRGILTPDPSQRYSIDAILTHPWLFGIGNVFPLPKHKVENGPIPNLNLSVGGFSASDLHQVSRLNIQLSHASNALPTISESNMETHAPMLPTIPQFGQVGSVVMRKQVQPRSISLQEAKSFDNVDDGTNVYHGPIMSQVVSTQDPASFSRDFEATLNLLAINYRRLSPLMFQLIGKGIQLTAEVCRLYGFRNVYIIAFKRLQGDGWDYYQLVSKILNAFKQGGK